MKYKIDTSYVNDFSVYEKNRLPGRSYFIPCGTREELDGVAVADERYKSSMVNVLSGEWGFKYFGHITDIPEEFDTETETLDLVPVPSVWQRTGYEQPYYLNARYQFPTTLPKVPDDMPAGVYVKKFTVSEDAANPVITFLGVCASLTLYINGKFVGFSEGSHDSAEFLIRDFVSAGENELLALVSKWSTGSYLECQDMFRDNGIFRDVYITENPEDYIYDIKTDIRRAGSGYFFVLSVKADARSMYGKKIRAEMVKDGKVTARGENYLSSETFIDFGLLRVKEWNPEKPELYELYITLLDGEKETQCIREKIGFRTVEINGERFLVNGRPVKIKGVNHHDTNPLRGFAMTARDILRDIELMKRFNVNCVRTSHYPPDPLFLRLCDEYGLYVVDEADIETSGTHVTQDNKPTGQANIISNDRAWLPRFLDRVLRMYERDKNRGCVIMWSLGNESGGWKNQDKCRDALKKISSIPVHYEGVCHTPRVAYDVVSEMYQSPPVLKKIGTHAYVPQYIGKPYFLCEYCHAMGVGPGSLEDYWKIFYEYPNLMGGCIWEWADHSVYDEKAEYAYTYGGDHAEPYHDSNFCVDGLFYPDRTPHTGAYEMKNVYRPIRAEKTGENLYRFTNTCAFTNASEYEIAYELFKNGVSEEKGRARFDIEPLSSKEVRIDHKILSNDSDVYINFSYFDKNGEEIAFEQLILSEKIKKLCPDRGEKLSVSEDGELLRVVFPNGEAVFSTETGALTDYLFGGERLLRGGKGFVPNVFRAPIDNDMHIAEDWLADGLNRLVPRLASFDYEENEGDGYAEVTAEGWLSAGEERVLGYELEYRLYSSGTVGIKAVLKKTPALKKCDLPKFGLNVCLDPSLKKVKYYGLGDRENLPDLSAQCRLGIYESDVARMSEDYIRPQDNGNHCGTRSLELRRADGSGVSFLADEKPFSFSVHPYTEETLIKAAHREDLSDDNLVSLNIDGFVRGAGTNSCGPDVLPEYRIDFKKELKFGFYLVPFAK